MKNAFNTNKKEFYFKSSLKSKEKISYSICKWVLELSEET